MRIGTIIFVYLAMAVVWSVMAQTMQQRHNSLDYHLRHSVSNLWGSPHRQNCPLLSDGRATSTAKVLVDLNLDYKKKGQYWYSTYTVDFQGEFELPEELPPNTRLQFSKPAGQGMFSDFRVELDGQESQAYEEQGQEIAIELPESGASIVKVSYTAQGSEEWWFHFHKDSTTTRNVDLTITTNFHDINFPDGGLSPAQRTATDSGWEMNWKYENLMSGGNVGIELPTRPNPGPALIDICRFGPMGLFFFFVALTVCSLTGGQTPHPVHYIFLGAGFFSFHLLLVYLGDVLPLAVAFSLSALTAIFINWTYGNRVFSAEFSRGRLVPALVLYLVLFSSAFLVEGYRGLPLSILLVVSLHMLMQISANVDWDGLEQTNLPEESLRESL